MLCLLLQEKTECYVKAGWWVSAHGQNAVLLLSIPKAGKHQHHSQLYATTQPGYTMWR